MDELSNELVMAERQKRAREVAKKSSFDLLPEDRKYYGAPENRGIGYIRTDGVCGLDGDELVWSCGGSNLVNSPDQIMDGESVFGCFKPSQYRSQVQEYLFRRYVGYPVKIWRTPSKPEAIAVYNEVCHEMGFPEEVIQVPEEHIGIEGGMTDAKTFTSPVVPPEDKTM